MRGARGAGSGSFREAAAGSRAVSAHSPPGFGASSQGPRAAWPATEHWRHRHTDITHQKDHHHEHLSPQPRLLCRCCHDCAGRHCSLLGLAGYGHEVTAPASEIVQLEPVEILAATCPTARSSATRACPPSSSPAAAALRPRSGLRQQRRRTAQLSGTQRRSTPGVLWFESPHLGSFMRPAPPGPFVRRPQPRSMEKYFGLKAHALAPVKRCAASRATPDTRRSCRQPWARAYCANQSKSWPP